MFCTWSIDMSEPVRRSNGGKQSIIVNYMNMGRVQSRYCRSIHSNILLHLEVTQMVVKLLLRGTEISITNAYILYVEKWNEINSKPMSHTELRRQLTMALVGDNSPDCAASTIT